MKRKIAISLILTLIIGLIPLQVFSVDNIKVVLNDTEIDFDVNPQIINNRTMVPMRAIFENLGMTVEYSNGNITASNGSDTVKMTIGVPTINKNGNSIAIDTAPMIINNRTLVPIRAISESLNLYVWWDNNTRTVIIYDKIHLDENKTPLVQDKNLSANFKIIKDNRPIKDDEGRLIVNRYYEKVVLEESNEIFKNINKLIQNNCNQFFAEHDELDYTDFSTDPYISDVVADEENAYFYFSNATVTNNSNGILSIVLEQDWCMGGVRNTNYYGLNYNLNTGTILELTDIFSEGEIQISDYLQIQTMNYIYENFYDADQSYIQECKQNISDYSVSDFKFYIEGKNVCLCYFEDELMPWSDSMIVKCPII